MRALLTAGALSLAFTLFLTPLFIRLFVRLGWGQFIRDDGPQSHHVKRGTPTMGGIIFILGTLFGYFGATLLSGEGATASGLLVLLMMVGLGVVGFVDDFLKTRKKQSLGLGGWAKVAGQLIVAPFSVRPLPGATVSMPLTWDEVNAELDPKRYTIKTAVERMNTLGTDPVHRVLEEKPDLALALQRLAERMGA